jgi:hypothetical protein
MSELKRLLGCVLALVGAPLFFYAGARMIPALFGPRGESQFSAIASEPEAYVWFLIWCGSIVLTGLGIAMIRDD